MKHSKAEYRSPFKPQDFEFLKARRIVTTTPYLTSRQKLVMHTILHFADNETGELYANQTTIARCAGLSRRSVNTTIVELRETLCVLEGRTTLRSVQREGWVENIGTNIPGALLMRVSMYGLATLCPETEEHKLRQTSPVYRLSLPARRTG